MSGLARKTLRKCKTYKTIPSPLFGRDPSNVRSFYPFLFGLRTRRSTRTDPKGCRRHRATPGQGLRSRSSWASGGAGRRLDWCLRRPGKFHGPLASFPRLPRPPPKPSRAVHWAAGSSDAQTVFKLRLSPRKTTAAPWRRRRRRLSCLSSRGRRVGRSVGLT